jgi:integrase
MKRTGYKRVYIHHGAYYFADLNRKFHRLCSVDDGEPAMVRALARFKDAPADRPGSMQALVRLFRTERLPKYAEDTRYDYGLMLDKIEVAFRDHDVVEVGTHEVMDFVDQWADKPRSANKYRALLSVLFKLAIRKRIIKVNPCRDVERADESPRREYQPAKTTDAVLKATVEGRRHSGTGKPYKNANGEMYRALFTLAYLTAQRLKDVRLLKWSDIEDTEIVIQPTKTRKSSGARIAITITPDIRAVLDEVRSIGKTKSPTYVFHTLKGGVLSKEAVKSAWRRARERAGHPEAWLRELRPKALSDAKRAGLTLEQLSNAAGHASVATTEIYIRGYEVKQANLGLTAPKLVNADKKK